MSQPDTCLQIKQWVYVVSGKPYGFPYGYWFISYDTGIRDKNWGNFPGYDGPEVTIIYYLWPDLKWRKNCIGEDDQHAYFETKEEAEKVLALVGNNFKYTDVAPGHFDEEEDV